jgi:hypothetical protein
LLVRLIGLENWIQNRKTSFHHQNQSLDVLQFCWDFDCWTHSCQGGILNGLKSPLTERCISMWDFCNAILCKLLKKCLTKISYPLWKVAYLKFIAASNLDDVFNILWTYVGKFLRSPHFLGRCKLGQQRWWQRNKFSFLA